MKVDIAPEEVYILANLFSGGRLEAPIEEFVNEAVDDKLDDVLAAAKGLLDERQEHSEDGVFAKYPKRKCTCSD